MREKEIEQYLVRRVKQEQGIPFKFNSEGNAGVPDRLLLFPYGISCFVELKAPGKKSRKIQTYQQNRIRQLGYTVFADVDSKSKVDAILNWYYTCRYFHIRKRGEPRGI